MLSQKLAQMFLKVAKIISTAVFTLIKIFKINTTFWLLFISTFGHTGDELNNRKLPTYLDCY